ASASTELQQRRLLLDRRRDRSSTHPEDLPGTPFPADRYRRQDSFSRNRRPVDHPQSPTGPRPSTSPTTAHSTAPRGSRGPSPHPAPCPCTGTACGSPPRRSPPYETPCCRRGG